MNIQSAVGFVIVPWNSYICSDKSGILWNTDFLLEETLQRLAQQDRTVKPVFVLGVYASAVHARWRKGNRIICQALAVASEPRIFWDGNPEEAKAIIDRIQIPGELGTLEPAGCHLNGPSARVLEEHILDPLGYSRKDAWLCDLLPETRLNKSQIRVLETEYEPIMEKYSLNPVTVPKRKPTFCDQQRCEEIISELEESQASLLVLLGDIPIQQFLNRITRVDYTSLQEYVNIHEYGKPSPAIINGRKINILPVAHPRQIGALGAHSEKWYRHHMEWEKRMK